MAGPFPIALLSRSVACCWDFEAILSYLLTKPGFSVPPASILISEEQAAARLAGLCKFPQVGHSGCSLSALFCLRFVVPPKQQGACVEQLTPRESKIRLSVSLFRLLCNPLTGAIQRPSAGNRRDSNWQRFRGKILPLFSPAKRNTVGHSVLQQGSHPVLSHPKH